MMCLRRSRRGENPAEKPAGLRGAISVRRPRTGDNRGTRVGDPARAPAASSRADVLVHAEHVLRVVLALDLCQAIVVRAVRGADTVALVGGEEVHVHAAAGIGRRGLEEVAGPSDAAFVVFGVAECSGWPVAQRTRQSESVAATATSVSRAARKITMNSPVMCAQPPLVAGGLCRPRPDRGRLRARNPRTTTRRLRPAPRCDDARTSPLRSVSECCCLVAY